MAFCCQVQDLVGLVVCNKRCHRLLLTDVGYGQTAVSCQFRFSQVGTVGGVGHLVDDQDICSFIGNQMTDKSRPDEAGAAGHDDLFHAHSA